MSIKYNNKVIASNKTPSSYRFVGEIFQSAIPIDDPKVHLLDGSLLSDTEGYKDFIQHLSSLQILYPQLFCTEEVWQEKVTQHGEWGQFVLSSYGVRLPKITSFVQGLNSLTDLATLIEAGLPNITGNFKASGKWDNVGSSGVFSQETYNIPAPTGSENNRGGVTYYFDASLSNPIYGNSNTVQPQAIRYPYYIVIATGVVQNIKVIQDIELNIPFFFGMSQYFETEPDNVSWLKSVGQWNMKSEYPDYYNWVLSNVNNGVENFKYNIGYAFEDINSTGYYWWISTNTPIIGQTVYRYTSNIFNIAGKISEVSNNGFTFTDKENYTYTVVRNSIYDTDKHDNTAIKEAWMTDYDFVLNTAEETFRLPVRTKDDFVVESKEATENDPSWYRVYKSGWVEQGGTFIGGSSNGWQTVNLLKEYSNNKYYVNNCKIRNYTEASASTHEYVMTTANPIKNENKTTTSFESFTYANNSVIWEAKGQGAETPENRTYFYVGETVQNASLINAGKVKERITRNYKEFTDLKQLPHIIETYINGTSWYRVYSDGWCEQGGILASVAQDTTTTVSLLKSYINSDYSVLITATGGARSSGQYMNGNALQSRDVSSFIIRTQDYTFGRVWEAKGYIF